MKQWKEALEKLPKRFLVMLCARLLDVHYPKEAEEIIKELVKALEENKNENNNY